MKKKLLFICFSLVLIVTISFIWYFYKSTILEPKYVFIRYHVNQGVLTTPYRDNISVLDGHVYLNDSIDIQKIRGSDSLPLSGLINYNNEEFLHLERVGYTIRKNQEWNTKADGSGKSFSQNKVYQVSDFCNASKKNCVVTLYANWKKAKLTKFQVATFNMGFFHCGSSSFSCEVSSDMFTDFLKNHPVDIIGLQEARTKDYYQSSSKRNRSNEIIRQIGKEVGLRHHYFTSPFNVNAILSKFPLYSTTSTILSSCGERRAIQKAILLINGVKVSYYNTHLSYNRGDDIDCAEVHLKDIVDLLQKDSNPIILTGDFNRISADYYQKFLLPLGFKVAAHDMKRHGIDGKESYMDAIYVLSRGHIDIVSEDTIITYGTYSDHNFISSDLHIKS